MGEMGRVDRKNGEGEKENISLCGAGVGEKPVFLEGRRHLRGMAGIIFKRRGEAGRGGGSTYKRVSECI